MTPHEFLTKVLPSADTGSFVAVFAKGDVVWNKSYATIDALADSFTSTRNSNLTSYFALGAFANNTTTTPDGKIHCQRKASMATAFKTLALDIDCGEGKPYPTQRDGILALAAFLRACGLPTPMMVSSGNGLHIYWPLDESVASPVWVTLATGLKALCDAHKFSVDRSKVNDASMVLRPIGTVNKRGGRIVTMLRDGGPFGVALLSGVLSAMPVPVNAVPAYILDGRASSAIIDVGDIPTMVYAPANPAAIVDKCEQMRRITINGGKDATEPLWYLAAGIASKCTDPEGTFINWSSGHAGYDKDKTIAKLRQWEIKTTGPAMCTSFDRAVTGVCPSCQFWGSIATPVTLGVPVVVPVLSAHSPQPPVSAPRNFTRADDGLHINLGGVFSKFYDYDMFPTHIVRDPANDFDESVWMCNMPMSGYKRVRIRLSHIVSPSVNELVASLGNVGIMVPTKTKQQQMGIYMRAYMQKLQREQVSIDLHDVFGWKGDYTEFVIGTTKYCKGESGVVQAVEVGISKTLTDKKLDTAFSCSGQADVWTLWTKVLAQPGMAGHAFALGVAFSAPLVALSGLSGFCLSMLGSGGEGKSTMQAWINSVYGNPKRLGMGKEDTKAAFVQRMGMVAHLPITIDEATLIDPFLIAELTYWATQGQDRNRQTTAIANNWGLPVTLSTNRSLRDKTAVVSSDTDAIAMRLIEFTYSTNTVFSEVQNYGKRISLMLQNNYGHMGRQYLAHLVALGPETLRERIQETTARISEEHDILFAGKERYWALALVLVDLGNTIANELGLIRYTAFAATAWAAQQVKAQRTQVEEQKLSPYDMIATYINEHNGMSLTIFYGDRIITQQTLPRDEVRVRKEIWLSPDAKPKSGYMYLDRFHFQRWLVKAGYDMKQVVETVIADGAEYRPNRYSRVYMGKDSPLKLGQVSVLGLNLQHERFRGMLDQDRELTLVSVAGRNELATTPR